MSTYISVLYINLYPSRANIPMTVYFLFSFLISVYRMSTNTFVLQIYLYLCIVYVHLALYYKSICITVPIVPISTYASILQI